MHEQHFCEYCHERMVYLDSNRGCVSPWKLSQVLDSGYTPSWMVYSSSSWRRKVIGFCCSNSSLLMHLATTIVLHKTDWSSWKCTSPYMLPVYIAPCHSSSHCLIWPWQPCTEFLWCLPHPKIAIQGNHAIHTRISLQSATHVLMDNFTVILLNARLASWANLCLLVEKVIISTRKLQDGRILTLLLDPHSQRVLLNWLREKTVLHCGPVKY